MSIFSFAKLAALSWLVIGATVSARPSRSVPKPTPPKAPKLPRVYGVLLYDSFTSLDVIGPISLLSNVPGVEIHYIYETMDHVPSGNVSSIGSPRFAGHLFHPTHTFNTMPKLDVLVVPGGLGTLRLTGDSWSNLVKKVYPELQYLFSVCTGAGIVAQSGVLDGKRATSNKAAFAWVKAQGPKVHWVAEARWVVDGNIWTSSGVEAGTDMANAFISTVYGQSTADVITDLVEYVPITNSSYDPFAAVWNLTASSDVALLAAQPEVCHWGMLAYPGFVALDGISVTTYMEFVALQTPTPGNISVIAHSMEGVPIAGPMFGQQTIYPTHTFANPPKDLSVLVVPGLPSAGPFPHADELTSFIRATYPNLKHIISVGTGSMLLASAGVLDGRQATTSKALFRPATYPFRNTNNITWTSGRWVRDGNVWTSSGSASGLDAANALSIELFGASAAEQATVMMEYIPRTNASDDPFAKVWGI